MPDALAPDALSLDTLPAIPRPGRVLMTTPDHFRVAYVINPHMEGNIGTVDRPRARAQWDALRAAYERLRRQSFNSDDVKEGRAALLERRAPRFTGR